MGHSIAWDNSDKTVVFQTYTEGVSKDDFYHLARKSANLLNTMACTVHLIVDERLINLVLSATDMKYLEKMTPKNQGAVVMVVQPSQLAYKTAVQVLGKILVPNAFAKPYFVDSIQAARQFLQDSFDVRYLYETTKQPNQGINGGFTQQNSLSL